MACHLPVESNLKSETTLAVSVAKLALTGLKAQAAFAVHRIRVIFLETPFFCVLPVPPVIGGLHDSEAAYGTQSIHTGAVGFPGPGPPLADSPLR